MGELKKRHVDWAIGNFVLELKNLARFACDRDWNHGEGRDADADAVDAGGKSLVEIIPLESVRVSM